MTWTRHGSEFGYGTGTPARLQQPNPRAVALASVLALQGHRGPLERGLPPFDALRESTAPMVAWGSAWPQAGQWMGLEGDMRFYQPPGSSTVRFSRRHHINEDHASHRPEPRNAVNATGFAPSIYLTERGQKVFGHFDGITYFDLLRAHFLGSLLHIVGIGGDHFGVLGGVNLLPILRRMQAGYVDFCGRTDKLRRSHVGEKGIRLRGLSCERINLGGVVFAGELDQGCFGGLRVAHVAIVTDATSFVNRQAGNIL